MIDLLQGDCLKLMKDIPDGSVDMILCDLPYGTTACKWDSVIPFEPMWEQYERIIKDNGAIVLFGSEPFSSALRMSNIKHYKYDWVWDKVNRYTGYGNCKNAPLRRYETISVFAKQKTTYNPQMTVGKPYKKTGDYSSKIYGTGKIKKTGENSGTRYPYNILQFKGDDKKNGFLHPTQKPVELCEYLIKTYTNEGETVLDNCMGSGSTGVACINTGRNFIGIELDKGYFNIAQKRIAEAQRRGEQVNRLISKTEGGT
jgi:site-specific DNA-methyltransferase (adenine-specific)